MKLLPIKIALLSSCFIAYPHIARASLTLVPDCVEGLHIERMFKFQGAYNVPAPASTIEEKDILSGSKNPEAVKVMNMKWNNLDKDRYMFLHGFEVNYMITSLAAQIKIDNKSLGNDLVWFNKDLKAENVFNISSYAEGHRKKTRINKVLSVFKKSNPDREYQARYVKEFSYEKAIETYMDWFLNRHMFYAATLVDIENPPKKTYFYAGLVLDIPGENIYQAANHDLTSVTDDEFFMPNRQTRPEDQEQFIRGLFADHVDKRLSPEEVLSPYKGETLGTANSLTSKEDINEVSFIRHVKKESGHLTFPTIKGIFINETMLNARIEQSEAYLKEAKANFSEASKNLELDKFKINKAETALENLRTIRDKSGWMAKALGLTLYKF
jgi:hypothetical protein